MGAGKRDSKIDKYQYTYDYENSKKLKRAFREFVHMSRCFETGDTDLASIYLDLKTVLGVYPLDSFEVKRLLDRVERFSIYYYLIRDLPLRECALLMGVAISTVSRNVDSGLEKIFKFLNKAMQHEWRVWTNKEIDYVLENYKLLGPEDCAKHLKRVTSDVERIVMYLKKHPEKYKFEN